MAHVRQEHAFGAAGHFGGVLSVQQVGFGFFLVGDVGVDADPFADVAVVIQDRNGAKPEDAVDAVAAAKTVLEDKWPPLGDAPAPFVERESASSGWIASAQP